MTFDDSCERLGALDGLEGFRPHGRSHYLRIMAPVSVGSRLIPAWVYVVGDEGCSRLAPYPVTCWKG